MPDPSDPKEHLILVHSFYTNSLLLEGFIEYLEDHFHVHFIDLPGFSLNATPLDDVSLENLVRYVEDQIEALSIPQYILVGVSFGYALVSRLRPDPRCRGIVAIFPFLGTKSLRLKKRKRLFYVMTVRVFDGFRLSSWAWRTNWLRKFAFWYSSYPPERVRIILDQMDGRTFFAVGRLILSRRHRPMVRDCPHVLILNPKDRTIRYEYVLRVFRDRAMDLLVLQTGLDHYPLSARKSYFQENFPEEDLRRIVEFLSPGRAMTERDTRASIPRAAGKEQEGGIA